MISKKYNEQMGNYMAKLARESKPQTNADICPHYRPNRHDRGDDSYCAAANCEVKAVKPVKHGRWMYLYDENYRCSVCGEDSALIDGTGFLGLLNYCPKCGARMDGET